MFGFCKDYDKVIRGFTHTLILIRNDDHDAIFRDAGIDLVKITLSKVSWFMPDVVPNLETKKIFSVLSGEKKN